MGISDIYDVRRLKANKTKKFIDRKKAWIESGVMSFWLLYEYTFGGHCRVKLGWYNGKGELSGLDVEIEACGSLAEALAGLASLWKSIRSFWLSQQACGSLAEALVLLARLSEALTSLASFWESTNHPPKASPHPANLNSPTKPCMTVPPFSLVTFISWHNTTSRINALDIQQA
jgi:hypothetical protein